MPKLGATCYITGSSSDLLRKSPIPTSKMNNTITVSMNRKLKFIVNETTDTRRSERLARKRSFQFESITDDHSNDHCNRPNNVNKIKRFKNSKSNKTKLEISTISIEKNYVSGKPCHNKLSYLGENQLLEIIESLEKVCNTTGSSSVLQKSPIPTGKINNNMSVSMKSKPKSLVNETTESSQPERLAQHESIIDDHSNDCNRSNDVKNIKLFDYSNTSENLHEQLHLIIKDLETFERDFYLLSKRLGIPFEKVKHMTIEDSHSVRCKIYSESITQSMITLSPMIPSDFKDNTKHNEESSFNKDLKLTNELDPLRIDIAYLINELDNLIDEFPKTLTSWGLSIVNHPLN